MFSGELTHQSNNQNSVARIAMGKETELLESIDKAIKRMVSEYPGRNESERIGSFEKFKIWESNPSVLDEGNRYILKTG